MAWDKTHKQHSKQRILDSAAFLFTHNGFDGVSIDEVMRHAGMTRALSIITSNQKPTYTLPRSL